jgi:putative ABC transport system ATP-binding protein
LRTPWSQGTQAAADWLRSDTGPSGSGKSTLLAILGLRVSPTAGEYWFDGTDFAELGKSERNRFRGRQLGFVFQSSYLNSGDSAALNTSLALRVRGVGSKDRRRLTQGTAALLVGRGPQGAAPLTQPAS